MEKDSFFWRMVAGELPTPPCAVTLGTAFKNIEPQAGTIETEFQGKPEFANPIGHIQGGFLAAMLDDTLGPAGSHRRRLRPSFDRFPRPVGSGPYFVRAVSRYTTRSWPSTPGRFSIRTPPIFSAAFCERRLLRPITSTTLSNDLKACSSIRRFISAL